MAVLMTRVRVSDYDAWKPMFDSDPHGLRAKATGERVLRLAEDPDELQVIVEFETADDAAEARELLLASGALDRVTVTVPPAVAADAG